MLSRLRERYPATTWEVVWGWAGFCFIGFFFWVVGIFSCPSCVIEKIVSDLFLFVLYAGLLISLLYKLFLSFRVNLSFLGNTFVGTMLVGAWMSIYMSGLPPANEAFQEIMFAPTVAFLGGLALMVVLIFDLAVASRGSQRIREKKFKATADQR
ncbi:MAG: hypothetical protein HY457_01870 [Parcubacteria group bacterium]|nr:hypothetical protein [Parcubacteria group bacterium]